MVIDSTVVVSTIVVACVLDKMVVGNSVVSAITVNTDVGIADVLSSLVCNASGVVLWN